MTDLTADLAAIKVGDRIRFTPRYTGLRWWTIRARDDRFIVATMQAPFEAKGKKIYTVVDVTGWADIRYNGAGNGPVRSSLDTLGGGWDMSDEGVARILPALQAGEWNLSRRRVLNIRSVEVGRRLEVLP
jgi:hypothetical protein